MASPAYHLSHPGGVRPVVTRIVRLAWTGSLRAVNDARQQAAGLPWRFGSRLRHRIGNVIDQLDETIRRFQIDPKQMVGQLFRTTGRAVGVLTFVFSMTSYWILSTALMAIYVFFFSWHFNTGVEKLCAYVPASRRERIRAPPAPRRLRDRS